MQLRNVPKTLGSSRLRAEGGPEEGCPYRKKEKTALASGTRGPQSCDSQAVAAVVYRASGIGEATTAVG